jgi:hypothetical protein
MASNKKKSVSLVVIDELKQEKRVVQGEFKMMQNGKRSFNTDQTRTKTNCVSKDIIEK